MIFRIDAQSAIAKTRMPNFGLLVESSNGTHVHAADSMMHQFQHAFDESFDVRMENLNRRRASHVNTDVATDEAIKRGIESVVRQVVIANHLLFGIESPHRLPFSFARQIGSSVYLVSTGSHRLFIIDGEQRTILDVDSIVNGLTNDPIYDIKRKEEAMRSGEIQVHCLPVCSYNRLILLSEDASQHLSIETLERLLEQTESSDSLEQEIELRANIARRESMSSVAKEIAALVMETE